MTTTEHKELLRTAYADLGRGNARTLLELFAPDVVYTLAGTTGFSGTMHGRDAVVQRLFAPLGAALAGPLELAIGRMVAEGDLVAVEGTGRATLRSGVRYDNSYCFVFRFAAGRIAAVTEYLDTALVTRAFTVPADRAALLRQMDLNMWEMFREIVRLGRGAEAVETPRYSMAFSPNGTSFHNMVMVRDAIAADELLAAVRDFYVRQRRVFSIWTRDHADQALEAALRERGLMELVSMPAMALLDDPGTRCEPAGLEIRPATDEQGRRDYLHVTAEAYATFQQPRALTEDVFVALESVCAPHVQGFVGYAEGAPVAAAAVYVTHGVAGIGWVGTVPACRGRGYAEAVTWAAIREGFRRGGAFANLQASPLGRPIYERMGFITPSQYRAWVGTL
jgi:ketosteroid isomerase-like protein/ribosomal protein S18 acetylase RimI-like enzyme